MSCHQPGRDVPRPAVSGRVLFYAMFLVGAFLASVGCQPEAQAQRSGVTKKTKQAVPSVISSLPGDPRAVLYVRSPLQVIETWQERVAAQVGKAELRSQILAASMGLADDSVLGPALTREFVLAVYAEPDSRTEPRFLLKVPGGTASVFNPCVDAFVAGQIVRAREEGGTRWVERESDFGTIFYGSYDQGWMVSNDWELVRKEVSGKTGSLAKGIRSGWETVTTPETSLFFGFDLDGLVDNAKVKQTLVTLGLRRVNGLSFAFGGNDDRFHDRVFLSTPSPHEGLLALFDGPRLGDQLIDKVPNDAVSFGAWGVDLAEVWERVYPAIPPSAQSQIGMMEQMLGIKVGDDFLASIGTLMVSWATPGEGQPTAVMSMGLRDRKKFEMVVRQLTAQADVTWSQGPQGADLMSVPGSGIGMAALTKTNFVWSDNSSVLNEWISGRLSVGKNSAVHDLVRRYGNQATILSWTKNVALGQDWDRMAQLRGMMQSQAPLPLDQLPASIANFPWFETAAAYGEVSFAFLPQKSGFEAVVESDCGILPVLLLVGFDRMHEMRRVLQVNALKPLGDRIRQAQENFRVTNGRFAENLWELQTAQLLDQEVADGLHSGFLYRVLPEGRNWRVEFRRESDNALFVYLPDTERVVPVQDTEGRTPGLRR